MRALGIPVQSYAIKRGHYKNIEGVRLKDVMETTFGPVQDEGGKFVASYGALERIAAWTDGKSLFVDTSANPKVDDDTAVRTRQAWNTFLERATGFDAKQRSKRAQDETKKGVPDVKV
ncbi:MAG: hypothetical protein E6K18_06075 [Methanobacteriota archaeon]|nr:MAG: hypothetical protein E6K18_06075 [Euryarchaeota archaeon]